MSSMPTCMGDRNVPSSMHTIWTLSAGVGEVVHAYVYMGHC